MNLFEIRVLPWPENLLRSIFAGAGYDELKVYMTPNLEATVNLVLREMLSEQESEVIYSLYRDGMSLCIIADRYNMNVGWCRQIRNKALRKLRHPARTKHLRACLVKVVMSMQ